MGITPVANGTAEERMQRTERGLIEAAIAVNEAPTLQDALRALSDAALSLVGADRVSIAEWDDDFAFATVVSEAGQMAHRGVRIPLPRDTADRIVRTEPFLVTRENVQHAPPQYRDAILSFGTFLIVPFLVEQAPAMSFQAGWFEAVDEHVQEATISKLRLLARLTGIAYRSEEARRRELTEARLRAVLDSVPDGLVVRSDDDTIVNAVARELLGVEGAPPERIEIYTLEGEPVDPSETPLQVAKRTGERQEYVLRVPRGDGAMRVHEGTIAPVKTEDGKVFATVTIFRDVTESHERRWVTEQFLQKLFEELPHAVALADPATGAILSVNQAYLDLVGYDEDEIVGVTEPYPWWVEPTPSSAFTRGRARSSYERLFRRKSGELIPVGITRSVICDSNDEPMSIVILIDDLSERRAFEQQLIHSGKLASIGELAAGVAHEVNNPLFAILGLVEFLLLDAEQGTKAHERLKLIQETALEIKEIVRALLDFARERSDERATISLAEVADQTVSLMRRMTAKKDVELVVDLPDAPVLVEASANQLKQIFVNLISNAQNAMPRGGTVTVTVGQDEDVAWADVRDTGSGIAADEVARIFEPFYTTRRDKGGTGLGLSVSFGIAQAHAGSLTVESTPGEGSVFRLRLPLAQAEEVAA